MKSFLFILLALITFPLLGQESAITLDRCYELAILNYPLAQQSQILEKQNSLDKKAIATTRLPQLRLEAQATYQSDVIQVPIPNNNIEPLNNDQYRATLSVNQLIYNGGATNASLDVKNTQLKTKQKQVEVNLYQLKKQINQLYFSVLLAQETDLLLRAKKDQLEAKQKEVRSAIKNGILPPASDKTIEAEILKLNQKITEVLSEKATLVHNISQLIFEPLSDTTEFQIPWIETRLEQSLTRPELDLFQLKKEEIESQEILLSKKNAPQLIGFVTGGYGNPGLNMLDNSFQAYYITGVKLSWNLFDWKSNKNQLKSLSLYKGIIDTEREVFMLHTNMELNQQQNEIDKIKNFITTDEAIVELRKEVLQAANSQLNNGVITTSSYITELTHLYEDENNLLRHQLQLQLAKANYNVIKGE